MDTTSVALTVVKRDQAVLSSVMDEMLKYRDADGLMLVRFSFLHFDSSILKGSYRHTSIPHDKDWTLVSVSTS